MKLISTDKEYLKIKATQQQNDSKKTVTEITTKMDLIVIDLALIYPV